MQLFYLAQKQQNAGNNNGAIQSYNEIVKLVSALPEPYLALGLLYSFNDDEESIRQAIQSYRKYIELSPNKAENDSLLRIVSVLEQLSSTSAGDDEFADLEWTEESVSDNTESDDRNKIIRVPLNDELNKTISEKKDDRKLFQGKWISDRFVQSTMIPQWVFDISCSDDEYSVSFHSASQRYSKYLDGKIKEPVFISDTSLTVRFARPEIYTPSESGYYIKTVISQVSNPLFVYSITGQEKNMKSAEVEERQKSNKALMSKLSEAQKNDRPEQRETVEELTFIYLSDYALKVRCKEILKIQRYGEDPVINESVFETLFYKIPDDWTFIMLGKDNCLITNQPETDEQPNKQAKSLVKAYRQSTKKSASGEGEITDEDLLAHLAGVDSLGYYQWYNRKEAKSILKTVGNGLLNAAQVVVSAATANQFAAVNTFSGMILNWLSESLYVRSVNSLLLFSDTVDDNLKVNPMEWNMKMYQSLLNHYGNNETIQMQTIY
jgi:hypothetical protein